MKQFEDTLRAKSFSKKNGYFCSNTEDIIPEQMEAHKVWSALASINHIFASAATDDKDSFSKYPSLIMENIPDRPIDILDAGCGYGRVAIPLIQNKPNIRMIGLDASTVMLEKFVELADAEFEGADMSHRLLLINSSVNQIPLPSNRLDVIYCCAVLIHNPYKNVESILKEFHRLLKPGGKAILYTAFPNIYTLEGIQKAAYLKICNEEIANGPVRVYSKRKINRLFTDWSAARIIPRGCCILPRQIVKIPLPFGSFIRGLNERCAQVFKNAFLPQHYDVIAIK